jgi:hypothetical protein
VRGQRLGCAVVDGFFNLFSNATPVLGHLVTFDSQNLKTLLLKEAITLRVATLCLCRQMVFTVNLDDQLQS